jgi:hypothetical protein
MESEIFACSEFVLGKPPALLRSYWPGPGNIFVMIRVVVFREAFYLSAV